MFKQITFRSSSSTLKPVTKYTIRTLSMTKPTPSNTASSSNSNLTNNSKLDTKAPTPDDDPVTHTQQPIIFAPKTYQYTKGHLDVNEVLPNPLDQFNKWFKEAQEQLPSNSDIIVESTNFSTARLPSGRVSSRIVLLKELDKYGFLVYSNWDTSKKAEDFNSNKYAALTFFWPHVQRQVRVEGIMEHVTRETSERYYNTRPRGSKIGAWASPQSKIISSRDDLSELNDEYTEKFKDLPDDVIPCPEYWGGIRIEPLEVEFWQGGVSRLHDRVTFRRDDIANHNWEIVRLAP